MDYLIPVFVQPHSSSARKPFFDPIEWNWFCREPTHSDGVLVDYLTIVFITLSGNLLMSAFFPSLDNFVQASGNWAAVFVCLLLGKRLRRTALESN